MKLKRNNPFPAETRNAVTVGEPGSGKKAFSSELIFARSDVSQLKQIPGNGTAEAIFANAKYKFIFKHN